jgi:hypothetical protein
MLEAPVFVRFAAFFDNLPNRVRAEVSLVIVALAGDAFIDLDEEALMLEYDASPSFIPLQMGDGLVQSAK